MFSIFANETQWKLLLHVSQINSLGFNTNKTNRKGTCEHITVKPEVIFHLGRFQKYNREQDTAPKTHRFQMLKDGFFLKITFSFLNFWSVKLAVLCGTVKEWQGHAHFSC